MSDEQWARVRAAVFQLTKRGPKITGADQRRFIEAVLWIMRTGAPWRDLPAALGKWSTVYRRYRRWALAGRWEMLTAQGAARRSLPVEEQGELLLIDSTIVKAHAHAAGALRRSAPKGGAAKRVKRLAARGEVSLRWSPTPLGPPLGGRSTRSSPSAAGSCAMSRRGVR